MKRTSGRLVIALMTAVVCGVSCVCSANAAAPYVVLPSGKKVQGSSVRANDEGQILLTTPQGVLTFPKGTTVVMSEPPEYLRAFQLIQQQQYEKAAETLEQVIRDYKFLQWDRKAKKALPQVYLKKSDYLNAVSKFEEVMKEMPGSLDEEEFRVGYLKALMGSGAHEKLKPLLNRTIRESPRNVAALAQMMRAELSWSAGEFEGALYDFMRTAEFFKDVADLQAEAYYRTGECLEKIGDPRAAEFYGFIVREHPGSPFAAKAGGKQP